MLIFKVSASQTTKVKTAHAAEFNNTSFAQASKSGKKGTPSFSRRRRRILTML
jgi:hypothetical protein